MSSPDENAPRLDVLSGEDDGTGARPRPLLRVVRGSPTDTELAALTATISALGAAAPEPEPRGPVSYWVSRADRLRFGPAQAAPRPGEGAWRYSTRPR
ncbi:MULTISPECIES: acyl-CoA carboxylase subunit epsilon [unclassified Saccharopolyspora]|uniref:acyl-CoA carboxylase subunit epsilon n=1 Tax=unclassified Saccharopolyspora TaxID=2646250 RepID=UPI001CD54418|nr:MULTISPECIES: acyl-CoA carboxylase subunit epsilon [unclassified Saccharopolyspora]MCA1194980.1 acyl-CoA carboxylase subunit epsilon [Saccharopolyspora sp. 6V]MCA1281742.1 acyl-CoA carboxylase subunit epsilon [Saccharopolyspora sp. 7B]